MTIEEIPDENLEELMRGRRSLFASNRRAAILACREMIKRREIDLGLRQATLGDSLRQYWREDAARANDFQVFA